MTRITRSLEETQALSRELVIDLVKGRAPRSSYASVVGLRGDLGAGKTTFVQGLAKALGIEEPVTSPTFILMRVHKLSGPTAQWKHLIHIDAYRLESVDELKHLGWDEITKDPGNLIVIEWADKIAPALPPDTIFVDFKHVHELTREISWRI